MHHFDAWDASVPSFWPRTATLDWCEENYRLPYLAETYNSLTNAVFLALAILGVTTARAAHLPTRFVLAHALTGVIGLGSFLFHATLTYTAQLLDELPMIYCVCVLTYTAYHADAMRSKRDQLLRVILAIDAVMVTLTYVLWWRDATFHQVAFGLHLTAIFLRGSTRVRALSPSPGKTHLIRLLTLSWMAQALGFVCWNVDNMACSYLRVWRGAAVARYGPGVGGVLAACLQMHGWWHCLTGLGAYLFITASVWMEVLRQGLEEEWRLQWWGGLLPVVRWAGGKSRRRARLDGRRHKLA